MNLPEKVLLGQPYMEGVGWQMRSVPEELFLELIHLEPGMDTRSEFFATRTDEGDLIVGFFPTGDTYERLTNGPDALGI